MISLYPGHKANELAKDAQERYKRAFEELKFDEAETNKLAEEYGVFQLKVIKETIKRFVDFLECIGRKASESEKRVLEGMDFSVQQIKEYKAATIAAEQYFMAGAKTAGAAAAGYGGAISVATSIGVASTGTAISSLSGAAATNAILAWFGGGAIAAGGGGMAVGALVIGGITAIPALAIGGFFAASEGEKAMTKAKEYVKKVNDAIEEINDAKICCQKSIKPQITGLRGVLESVNHRTIQSLNQLESQPFDSKRDAEKFRQTGILVKGLIEILNTPVLNSDGKLNLGAVIIIEKYRIYQ